MSRLPTTHRLPASVLLSTALLVIGAATATAHEGQHTVGQGETLADIAARNHTTVRALAEANGIANADRIIIGQVLVIPGAEAAPASVVHVVAPGETLSGIAGRYGTTSGALADANGIADRDLIRIGARLTVPSGSGGGDGSGAAAAPAASHTIASGETLGSIAARYGTSIGAIVAANGISEPNVIYSGFTLTIPAGGTATSGTATGGAGPGSTSAYAGTGGHSGQTGVAGTHTVAAGETLRGIAAAYGIAPEALAAANGILVPWDLYADARLQLTAPNRAPVDAGCPVPGATFVNDWGFPRSGGRAHSGTDLFAPRGTPVLAPAGGTVSFATGTIGGKQFRLVGDDGMVYLGSHLDDFGTDGGVAAGDVIGYIGSTGNAAGGRPHLHFEIHPDGGSAMNPYPVVRAAC